MLKFHHGFLAVAVALLAGCGGNSHFHKPPVEETTLWIANAQAISGFSPAAEATGNIEPSRMISGGLTTLSGPISLVFDQSGNMYVADFLANAVDVFPAGALGNIAPTRRIVGPATGMNHPEGIGVDAMGNIFVANRDGSNITIYDANADGNAAPIRTIGGGLTTIDSPAQMVVLPDGDFYVMNAGPSTVLYFAAGLAGNVSPTRSLNISVGVGGSYGLAVDANHRIYACTIRAIGVYAAGASGNDAPLRTISGPATQLSFLEGLAVDAEGNIYASDNSDNAILIYGPTANGDAAPTRVVGGGLTLLHGIAKLALH